MEKIDIILKDTFINVVIFITFSKLINYKYTNKNKAIIFMISFIESLLEMLFISVPTIIRLIVMCTI